MTEVDKKDQHLPLTFGYAVPLDGVIVSDSEPVKMGMEIDTWNDQLQTSDTV